MKSKQEFDCEHKTELIIYKTGLRQLSQGIKENWTIIEINKDDLY